MSTGHLQLHPQVASGRSAQRPDPMMHPERQNARTTSGPGSHPRKPRKQTPHPTDEQTPYPSEERVAYPSEGRGRHLLHEEARASSDASGRASGEALAGTHPSTQGARGSRRDDAVRPASSSSPVVASGSLRPVEQDFRLHQLLDQDEVNAVLREAFYADGESDAPPHVPPLRVRDTQRPEVEARETKDAAIKRTSKPAKPKPDHYQVVCVSLYEEDVEKLDRVVAYLRANGHRRVSRSFAVRTALQAFAIDADGLETDDES